METSKFEIAKWLKIIAIISIAIMIITKIRYLVNSFSSPIDKIDLIFYACYLAMGITSLVLFLIGIIKKRKLLIVGAVVDLASCIVYFCSGVFFSRMNIDFENINFYILIPLFFLLIIVFSLKKKRYVRYIWYMPVILYLASEGRFIIQTPLVLAEFIPIILYASFGLYLSFGGDIEEQIIDAQNERKISFYNTCVAQGITSISSEKDIQKATLIAQSKEITDISDISALFKESERLANAKIERQRENALENTRQEERLACSKLEKYSGYAGRDKRIAMLNDLYNEALSGSKALLSGGAALIDASQQKEIDWATHGGIASGIAGPAAGIATAMDIQAKNAEIRAQNKENIKTLQPILSASLDGYLKHQNDAKSLANAIEQAKIKLVADDSPSDYLKSIVFSDAVFEISSTGSCTVHVNAKLNEPFMIFDDVKASIDGVLIARIYDGDNVIGTAKMVLPLYGVYTATEELVGMALFCGATPDKHYKVTFSPLRLWAIER